MWYRSLSKQVKLIFGSFVTIIVRFLIFAEIYVTLQRKEEIASCKCILIHKEFSWTPNEKHKQENKDMNHGGSF